MDSVLRDHPLFPPRPKPDPYTAEWIAELIQTLAAFGKVKLRKLGLEDLLREEILVADAEREGFVERIETALRKLTPADQQRMIQTAGELRLHGLWEQHRDTYEPHPAMTRELMKLKSDVKIPGEVLTRLRHINPMILVPDAPGLIHADGLKGEIIAVTVTGVCSPRYPFRGNMRPLSGTNNGVPVDTHSPDANAYRVLVHSTVLTHDDKIQDMDVVQFTVPTQGEFTLDELVDVIVNDAFSWAPDVRIHNTTSDTRRQYMTTCARAAVSHLLYACSRTVELDDKPRSIRPPAKPGKGGLKIGKSPRVRRMGWQIGAVIADTIRRAASGQPAGPGTGKKRRPHMRGAHLHLYRVGPGRQEIDLKWLDPIPVNAGKDDGRTITNHPMH